MRPLKISATFCSPLAGEPPKLDALLEWVMSLRMKSVLASSNGHRHAGWKDGVPGSIPIPIARVRRDGFPHLLPLCSEAILPVSPSDGTEHFCRRLATEHAAMVRPECRRIISTSSDEFKSYRLPLRVRPVDRAVWFAVGVGTNVRKLLREVRAIGKKTAMGYGRVAQWTVEPIKEDLSWFAPSPDGPVLMRTLPAGICLPEGLIGYRPWFGSPVGPYWDRRHFCEVVQPC
jgi:hypothetical protein